MRMKLVNGKGQGTTGLRTSKGVGLNCGGKGVELTRAVLNALYL
jgi:hypothetical protein